MWWKITANLNQYIGLLLLTLLLLLVLFAKRHSWYCARINATFADFFFISQTWYISCNSLEYQKHNILDQRLFASSMIYHMSCFAYLEFVRFKISEIKTANKLHQHNRWNDFKSWKQQNNRIDSNIKTLTFFARWKLIEHVMHLQKMLQISTLFWFFQAVDLLSCSKPCSTVVVLFVVFFFVVILVGVAKIPTCVVSKITCICNVCTKVKIYHQYLSIHGKKHLKSNKFMWFCDQFLCFVFAALLLLLFFFIFLTVCWDCFYSFLFSWQSVDTVMVEKSLSFCWCSTLEASINFR